MKSSEKVSLVRAGNANCSDRQFMEFHVNAALRRQCGFDETLFASSGNIIFANVTAVQLFAEKYNRTVDGTGHDEWYLKTGQLNAMGLIDEVFHFMCRQYRLKANRSFFSGMAAELEKSLGAGELYVLLEQFTEEFPPRAVYRDKRSPRDWLKENDHDGIPNAVLALEELMLLRLANENPAFGPFSRLFNDRKLAKNPQWVRAWDVIKSWSAKNPAFGPEGLDLVSMLKAPVVYSPYDLKGQLDYIKTRWMDILGEWLTRLLSGIDLIAEEEKAGWSGGGAGGSFTPDMDAYEFGDISKEYERFSPDRDWMPNVVLMAKSALVWLSQLTEKYRRPITRLDQIPDEELDFLASAGFTGLWLIGLWERSPASARIKQICGNPEAAASAYSLDDYDIAGELGGWDALNNLRTRAWKRGLRMASDMVPNHTGMDGKWVVEKPDLFVQSKECPFPGYDFNGENLSHDGRVGIYLENHYYSKTDCAVVFKRVDNATGDTRYIYHGNDGTGMPWNDTAQIDFLNPEAREEVIRKILHVARNFPIIRFDAAMVLAKKHIQRLWYPEPGKGGDIASRSRFAVSRDEFERRIPEEFWREVVDRCAREIPDTLLLAEAFWMMEGYFVRTLGMHRVYNSAFMNMLKREDNAKYRTTIKNTIEFDPEILKRYVNFMNNPDEETAVAQFGKGDKYFGVCTMMVAMPGLPMFGHGQVEGLEEKYGMEYRRAYRQEQSDQELVERHRREIFPLMKKRWLFAGVENFRLYDFFENGQVNENVFVWSNRAGGERALIFFNNKYDRATGWIRLSAASLEKYPDGSKNLAQKTVAESLGITAREGRFCIMQEQRSGLWYLRATTDIEEHGLFASLDGFQTQVFVNLYEVDDDGQGNYRTLCETLCGRGIENVHMGIQNIRLKELYAGLSALANPEYFRSITTIRAGKALAGSDAFVKSLEPRALAFFATVMKFLEGDFGAASLDGIEKRAGRADYGKAFARFSVSLGRLLALPAAETQPPANFRPGAVSFLTALNRFTRSIPRLDESLGCAILLLSLRELLGPKVPDKTLRDLIELWSLDLKLAEILAETGADAAAAKESMRLITGMMAVADAQRMRKKDRTALFARNLFSERRNAPLLGIHAWDNVVWFNKEAAEKALGYALVLAALAETGDAAGRPKTGTTEGDEWGASLADLSMVRKEILSSFETSGYRVDAFVESFAQKKIEPATKKASEAKSPVTRKSPKKKAPPAK